MANPRADQPINTKVVPPGPAQLTGLKDWRPTFQLRLCVNPVLWASTASSVRQEGVENGRVHMAFHTFPSVSHIPFLVFGLIFHFYSIFFRFLGHTMQLVGS